MSTDFTLFALTDEQVPMARRYQASSLGYGNDDFAAIVAAARDPGRMDIWEQRLPSFVVDGDHSMHDDEPCVAHALSGWLRGDTPVIDDAVTRRVLDLTKGWPGTSHGETAEQFRARLSAWLDGARGRHLWHCYV